MIRRSSRGRGVHFKTAATARTVTALWLDTDEDDLSVDGDMFSTRGGIWIMAGQGRTWSLSFRRPKRTATWPFAQLRMTSEQLVISSVFGTLTVTPANVVSIALFNGIPPLGQGLRFEVNDRREITVFWTYRRVRIVKELTFRGWTVDEEP